MDVFRTKFIGAALLSCLLTPSSPTVGEPATCSADKYCGYFWSGAHVETREPRLPEVDLQGRAATATRIRQAITQLALDDLGSDEILLIELVIKNGRILGPLVLENLTVPFGLRFESVSLPAAKFRNTDFQKQLTFSNVRWHRRFYADKSEFQQGLEFRSGTRFENQDRSVTTVLQIDKSAIDRDMLISQTGFFGDVALYNNKIDRALRIDSSHFNYSIDIRDNAIGNLDLYNTMLNGDLELFSNNIERMELKDVYVFGTMDINQNLFLDYVTIASVVLAPKQGGPEARIVFANNEISKELQFSADYVSSVVDEIELVANTVRGRTLLEFPWDRLHCGELPPPSWLRNVRLNLQNSRFESELRLRTHDPSGKCANFPAPRPSVSPTTLYLVSSSSRQRRLAALHKQVVQRLSGSNGSESERDEDTYCYSRATEERESDRLLVIDFGSARVARLAWDLPSGDCRYQWLGSDFRYERWTGSEEEQEKWIYQLAAPQPSTIYYVAEQLRAEGHFDKSRDLFLEAKRISYEPRSQAPYQTCSWNLTVWHAESCARQYMLYWYLTVSGFGVKPEFAVLGLAATWVAGLLVYLPYSWRAHTRDPAASAVIPPSKRLDRPVDRITDRRAQETGPLSGRNGELEEDAPAFAYRQPRRHPIGPVGDGEDRPPAGFALHQEQEPKRFSLSIFSLDAALPVINLHAYDNYYPESFAVQLVSYAQHVLGWILVSSLIASLAVL